MKENEIFLRLAEIRSSAQNDDEKCYQAFLLVAFFLQSTAGAPVPLEFKQRLRAMVDDFYDRTERKKLST